MNRQQQIKAMANMFAYRPCSGNDCAPCERMGSYCRDYLSSEKMYNAGYRRLPVVPGDTVFTIHRGKIKEWKVYFVGINLRGEFNIRIADEPLENSREFWDRDIGEWLFLTEEDAINELKERKCRDGL